MLEGGSPRAGGRGLGGVKANSRGSRAPHSKALSVYTQQDAKVRRWSSRGVPGGPPLECTAVTIGRSISLETNRHRGTTVSARGRGCCLPCTTAADASTRELLSRITLPLAAAEFDAWSRAWRLRRASSDRAVQTSAASYARPPAPACVPGAHRGHRRARFANRAGAGRRGERRIGERCVETFALELRRRASKSKHQAWDNGAAATATAPLFRARRTSQTSI